MKKIIITLTLVLLIILTANTVNAVEYYEIDNVDRSKIVKETFENWINEFKKENAEEERKIIDFRQTSLGFIKSNKDEILATVEFYVTPENKENTKWNYDEPREVEVYKGHKVETRTKTNICFIEMKKVNGNYKLEYIGEKPKGYDEFEKRFEEYKNSLPEETKIVTSAKGQNTEANFSNQKIETMTNGIIIFCAAVLIITFGAILIFKIKKNK